MYLENGSTCTNVCQAQCFNMTQGATFTPDCWHPGGLSLFFSVGVSLGICLCISFAIMALTPPATTWTPTVSTWVATRSAHLHASAQRSA